MGLSLLNYGLNKHRITTLGALCNMLCRKNPTNHDKNAHVMNDFIKPHQRLKGILSRRDLRKIKSYKGGGVRL